MRRKKEVISNFLPENLGKEVLERFSDADELVLEYRERGSGILIYTDKGSVSMRQLNEGTPDGKKVSDHDNPTLRTNREYLIRNNEAPELLKAIQIMTPDGKIRNDMIRKYNQIDRFVELIEDMLRAVSNKKESITVLDCACGKSYLSFVLNYYIKEKLKKNCYFIGLDINEKVIESSRKMALSLGYKNMEFITQDIGNFMPTKNIDIVISLHGCDIATDMALAAGVRYKAEGIVVIPCCQKELLGQIESPQLEKVLRHGILKSRFSDILTDGVRTLLLEAMGYEASVVEYISPLDTPKNLMIRASRKGNRDEQALNAYRDLQDEFHINPALARYLYLD